MESLKSRFTALVAALATLGAAEAPFTGDRRRKADWEAACAAAEAALAAAKAAQATVPAVNPDRMSADRARILGAADAALLARIRASKGTLPTPIAARVEPSPADRARQADECAAILAADFAKDRAEAVAARRRPLTGRPFAALLGAAR